MYTENNAFEWDAGKTDRNAAKHGISFPSAALALDDHDAPVRGTHTDHQRPPGEPEGAGYL